jgi:hypothetical protein
MSEEHCNHVSQIFDVGGNAALFDIVAPVGLDNLEEKKELMLVDENNDLWLDEKGTLAPTFNATTVGHHVLYFDLIISDRHTRRHLELVFGSGAMDKLSKRISYKIVLACAKIAQKNTLAPGPMAEGVALTRRAQMNASVDQFANWIFLKVLPSDPCLNSPYNISADNTMNVTIRPNPRTVGTATHNSLADRCRAHYGKIYDEPPLPPAMVAIWPFQPFKAVIENVMNHGGFEKPTTVSVASVHPKKAAWTVKEVLQLKKHSGKFQETKTNTDLFSLVCINTIVFATDYKRLTDKTKISAIITNRKSWVIETNVEKDLVPLSLVSTTSFNTLTWKFVNDECVKGTTGYRDLLFNILQHVVEQYQNHKVQEAASDSENSEDDEEGSEVIVIEEEEEEVEDI